MRFIVLTLSFLFFSLGQPALADKLPDEVMEPYKQYRAAFSERDFETAQKYAKAAWDAAEDKLGDHKTTGDLAFNYAQLFDVMEYNPDLRKAYERSVALSGLHETQAESIEIQRRVALSQNSLYANKDSLHLRDLEQLDQAIIDYGFLGSTFSAEASFLRSRFLYHNRKYEESLQLNERSIEMFTNADPKYPSALFYSARMDRADILLQLDRDLDAALQYQEVMQNVEGELSTEHVYVKSAFSKWLGLRYKFEEAGNLDDAEQAGLCQCWPYENYKDKVFPLKRFPARLPPNVKRSGYVQVMYDVNDKGETENIRVLESSVGAYEKPSIRAVKKWVYTPKTTDEPENARKDLTTRLTFVLYDEHGRPL